MQRHESFLELVHRHLSQSGTSVPSLARAIDEFLVACGECVPTQVAVAAIEIRTVLARDGIVAARLRFEAMRRGQLAARPSGVFEGLYPEEVPVPPGADVRHRLLKFEVDGERHIQLLSLDGPTPAQVGQPRHAALLHYIVENGPTSLFEAIQATQSGAKRGENIFYELRGCIGDAWFRDSGYGRKHHRILKVVRPAGCRLFKEHVVMLTDARAARRKP